MVYDGRITAIPTKTGGTAHKVYYPHELQENIPSVALLAKLANTSMFGAEYANSRKGMRQVAIGRNLSQKGADAWRAAHQCSCGSIRAVNGTCMAGCE